MAASISISLLCKLIIIGNISHIKYSKSEILECSRLFKVSSLLMNPWKYYNVIRKFVFSDRYGIHANYQWTTLEIATERCASTILISTEILSRKLCIILSGYRLMREILWKQTITKCHLIWGKIRNFELGIFILPLLCGAFSLPIILCILPFTLYLFPIWGRVLGFWGFWDFGVLGIGGFCNILCLQRIWVF